MIYYFFNEIGDMSYLQGSLRGSSVNQASARPFSIIFFLLQEDNKLTSKFMYPSITNKTKRRSSHAKMMKVVSYVEFSPTSETSESCRQQGKKKRIHRDGFFRSIKICALHC